MKALPGPASIPERKGDVISNSCSPGHSVSHSNPSRAITSPPSSFFVAASLVPVLDPRQKCGRPPSFQESREEASVSACSSLFVEEEKEEGEMIPPHLANKYTDDKCFPFTSSERGGIEVALCAHCHTQTDRPADCIWALQTNKRRCRPSSPNPIPTFPTRGRPARYLEPASEGAS